MKIPTLLLTMLAAVFAALLSSCSVEEGLFLPNAAAEHDSRNDIVARDRNGEPVRRYQLGHCGVEYEHRSHWYGSHHSEHGHWCPGGRHQHH